MMEIEMPKIAVEENEEKATPRSWLNLWKKGSALRSATA